MKRLILTGSVSVLLLTLQLVTMTSAYLKDWDANNLFNHYMQWPVKTSYQSAVSRESCIPSILTAWENWNCGRGGAAFPWDTERCGRALLFLLCCLPSLLPKGKADELCPCPVPPCCPRPLPTCLAAKADSSVVEHLSWQWEKSCPSFLLHIYWVWVCLPPQLETLVYIV